MGIAAASRAWAAQAVLVRRKTHCVRVQPRQPRALSLAEQDSLPAKGRAGPSDHPREGSVRRGFS